MAAATSKGPIIRDLVEHPRQFLVKFVCVVGSTSMDFFHADLTDLREV